MVFSPLFDDLNFSYLWNSIHALFDAKDEHGCFDKSLKHLGFSNCPTNVSGCFSEPSMFVHNNTVAVFFTLQSIMAWFVFETENLQCQNFEVETFLVTLSQCTIIKVLGQSRCIWTSSYVSERTIVSSSLWTILDKVDFVIMLLLAYCVSVIISGRSEKSRFLCCLSAYV